MPRTVRFLAITVCFAAAIAGVIQAQQAQAQKRSITEKDIFQAVAEGFDHIETLKRYSTAGQISQAQQSAA